MLSLAETAGDILNVNQKELLRLATKAIRNSYKIRLGVICSLSIHKLVTSRPTEQIKL